MAVKTRPPGPTVDSCVHHDMIEPPDGPTSIGRCRKCGRQKVYQTPYQSTYGNPQQKFPKIALQRAEDWDSD